MNIRWLTAGRPAARPVLGAAALLLGCAGLAGPLATPAHAAGTTDYTVTTLHAVTGETFLTTRPGNPVNGAGLIAGAVIVGTGTQEAAVFNTRTSTVRRLGFLVEGRDSFARDVNIRGDVVGNARVADNVSHAFAVRAGTTQMIDLGTGDGPTIDSDANAVNDHGVIAGWEDDSASNRDAVTWTLGAGTGVTVFNIGKAIGSTASLAYSVNNGGYALVTRYDMGHTRDFIWLPELHYAMPIKPLPGDYLTSMADLNDAGYAVGVSVARTNGFSKPMLWSSKTQTAQPLPYTAVGSAATPSAINAKGTIVGDALVRVGSDVTLKPVVWNAYGASVSYLPIGSNPTADVLGINVYGLAVGQYGAQGQDGTSVVWRPVTTSPSAQLGSSTSRHE